MESFREIKQLGRGAFGVAVLVEDIAEAKLVRPGTGTSRSGRPELRVIKKIDLASMELSERTKTLTEVKVLERFSHNSHPNIVAYQETFLNDCTLHIVMEFADGGDLARAIRQHRDEQTSFGEQNAFSAFAQCLQALKHIHTAKPAVLHRDIKPQNIFLTEAGLVKLGDFGIARICEHTQSAARTTIGTPSYMAPEVCNNSPYGPRADIWSLGVVLYELLVLQQPFQGSNLCALVLKIVTAEPLPLPEEFSEQAQDVISRTLAKNPDDRSTAEELLNFLPVRRRVGETFRATSSSKGGWRPATGRAATGNTASRPETGSTAFNTAGEHTVGTYSCADSVDRLVLDATAAGPEDTGDFFREEEQLAEDRRLREDEERRRTREIAMQAKRKNMGCASDSSPFWTSAEQPSQRSSRPGSGQAHDRPTSGQFGGSRPPSGQPIERTAHGYLGDTALQTEGGSLPSDFREARTRLVPVTIQKQTGAKLGLVLGADRKDFTILIEEVAQGGLLEQWNAARSASSQIRAGDQIVEVNGVRGNMEKMFERLEKDETLDMIVQESMDDRPATGLAQQSRLDPAAVSSRSGMGSRTASKSRLQIPAETGSLVAYPTPAASRTPAASSTVARRPRTGPAATPADSRSMLRTPPTSGPGAARSPMRGAGLDIVGSNSRPSSQPGNSRPASRQPTGAQSRPTSTSRPNSRQGPHDPSRRVASRGASPASLRHQSDQDVPNVANAPTRKGRSPPPSRSGLAVREPLLGDKPVSRPNSRGSSASRIGGVPKVSSVQNLSGAPMDGTALPVEERFAWAAKFGNASLEQGRRFVENSSEQPKDKPTVSCVEDLMEQIVRMEKTPHGKGLSSDWGAISPDKQTIVPGFANGDNPDALTQLTMSGSWGGAVMCESGTQLGRTGTACGGAALAASNGDTLSMLRQAINEGSAS